MKLAEVMALAAAKTRELGYSSIDGVASRELLLAQQIESLADKFRVLAQDELANPKVD